MYPDALTKRQEKPAREKISIGLTHWNILIMQGDGNGGVALWIG